MIQIYSVGDNAITVSLADTIDEHIHQQVMSLYHQIQEQKITGVKDIIPAYCSVTIVYDVCAIRKHHASAHQFIEAEIRKCLSHTYQAAQAFQRNIKIPICYHPSLAIDIEPVCQQKNISQREFIDIHSQKKYQVYMIGFLPGFSYMGKVDERIALPRHATPRTKIAAGSVGIASEQTGIYPFDSPGGWNIIGRTPIKMFDATKESPCFLNAGDIVEFVPISLEEFNKFYS